MRTSRPAATTTIASSSALRLFARAAMSGAVRELKDVAVGVASVARRERAEGAHVSEHGAACYERGARAVDVLREERELVRAAVALRRRTVRGVDREPRAAGVEVDE